MRLLLVDNLLLSGKAGSRSLDVHPHLGLMSLVAVAEAGGHHAEIFDPKHAVASGLVPRDASLYLRLAESIAALSPEAVGFTTLGCSFLVVVKIARYLKRMLPGVPILLGGPHATILHREILEGFDSFDVVVRNEAENTLLPVLDALPSRRFDHIEGVTWRARGLVRSSPGSPTVDDLDALPFPAYDRHDLTALGLTSLCVDAGRGCPFHCTFCSTASFFGRSYRLKSPERLVSELDRLHARWGIVDFKLNHDLFTVDKRKVKAFCDAVRGRGYTWVCSARVDCVDEALLGHMRDAGCRGIYFGIESGSPRMQRISQKRMDVALVEPTCAVVERLGMSTVVSYITGYPEEEQADQDATLDMIGQTFRRDTRRFTTQLHMLAPEPGTALYTQHRGELLYDGYLTDFNFETVEPDDAEIMQRYPEIFVTHHYYRTVLPREQHVFVCEAHRTLRRAGHEVLGYALRFFEGRLSRLVGEMHTFGRARSGAGLVDDAFVIDFVEGRFGAAHHLTSLVRHAYATANAVCAQREAGPAPRKALPARVSPDTRLRLDPRAVLLSNIHDCPRLLRSIAQDPLADAPLAAATIGETGDLLTVIDDAQTGTLDNYVITEPTSLLLSLFRTPMSYRELCAALSPLCAGEVPDFASIQGLVALGALVFVSD